MVSNKDDVVVNTPPKIIAADKVCAYTKECLPKRGKCCQNFVSFLSTLQTAWEYQALHSTPMNGKSCTTYGNGPKMCCASCLHSEGQSAQSSSIQSETRTPVSMAEVEHMSSAPPFRICLAALVRRYSALVWIQVHPPPGLEASSPGTRSSTTGCQGHSRIFRAASALPLYSKHARPVPEAAHRHSTLSCKCSKQSMQNAKASCGEQCDGHQSFSFIQFIPMSIKQQLVCTSCPVT